MSAQDNAPRLPARLYGSQAYERAGFTVWAPPEVASAIVDRLLSQAPTDALAGSVKVSHPSGLLAPVQVWWIRTPFAHVRDMFRRTLDA